LNIFFADDIAFLKRLDNKVKGVISEEAKLNALSETQEFPDMFIQEFIYTGPILCKNG